MKLFSIFVKDMTRIKKKPDLGSIGDNPFKEGLLIDANKQMYDIITRSGNREKVNYSLENIPYTKVFEVAGAKKRVMSLPVRGKELLLYFMHSIDSGADALWIDRASYMKAYGIKSVNTFKDAVRSLSESLFIYPHATFKDVYWINPHYFFKGSRMMKYPDRVQLKNRLTVSKEDK
jgi:hypothetical protein